MQDAESASLAPAELQQELARVTQDLMDTKKRFSSIAKKKQMEHTKRVRAVDYASPTLATIQARQETCMQERCMGYGVMNA